MTVTEEDLVGSLLDFTPSLPCEAIGHSEGEDGCDPPAPAEWIVTYTHPHLIDGSGDEVDKVRTLVCGGWIIRFRGRAQQTFRCTTCGQRGVLADLIHVIGRISP